MNSLASQICSVARPALKIEVIPTDSEIPVGATKFGGKPDLSDDMSWPEYEGKLHTFIGQFRLEDVQETQAGRLLPRSGLLSFFVFDDPIETGHAQILLDLLSGRASSDRGVTTMEAQSDLIVDKSIMEKQYHPKRTIGNCRTWLLLAIIAVFVIYRLFYYEPLHWYASAVAFSPDGKTIAVGIYRWDDAYDSENYKFCISGIEQTVKLVNVETGQELHTIEHVTHEGTFSGLYADPMSWLLFSPDGSLLAIGNWDGDVLLWEVKTQQVRTKSDGSDRLRVRSVEFSPDGKKLAIVNRSYVEVCELSNPEELTPMDIVDSSEDDQTGTISGMSPASVAFSADGSQVALGDLDRVDVSDVATGRWLNRYEWDGPTGKCTPILGTSDSSTFVRTAVRRQIANGQNGSPSLPTERHGRGDDTPPTVKLLDFATGKQRTRIDCSYGRLRFSPDGSLLGVGGRGGLHLIDPVGEKMIKTLAESSIVLGFDFSPEGKQVAVGDTDGKLTLWDYETGKQVGSMRVVWQVSATTIMILIAFVSVPFLFYVRKRSCEISNADGNDAVVHQQKEIPCSLSSP